MDYRQYPPPASLGDYISDFGVMHIGGAGGYTKVYKVLTDGCPGLIFMEHISKGMAHLYLHGLSTQHFDKTFDERFNVIIVHFKPTALKAILGVDAHEMTNNSIDFKELTGTDITGQLINAASVTEQINILNAVLNKMLRQNRATQNPKIHHAINLMQQPGAQSSLQEIQSGLNVTERTLERMFQQHVGVSPKLYSRILRFKRSLSEIRRKDFAKLSDVAYENDYADQSHHIREFKTFTGVTPFQFLQRASGEIESFPEWIA